ncbi:hypothetical protein [Methylobacterium aerolatum]|uniref:Uncharacterized protein n=1 Tax=Methylobacterium aerolatum TaxID=418708 RepID=A0ABU0HZQ8_9HYPH|nr:hypothetical protein [Methylobacterium aerolatum]MDQ0447327.1 hypothetical protein [Methylobacterium aerolatum]GJD36991.1 hypothetical protein FMGBMHLM_3917 [Methylobacterium aerolatum]
MSEFEDHPHTITGRGLVSAEGCEAVRVRYRFVLEQGPQGRFAHGTLIGRHAGLRPIWMEPDAVLRLKTGRTLPISLTDLVDDVAEFETVGPIPPL